MSHPIEPLYLKIMYTTHVQSAVEIERQHIHAEPQETRENHSTWLKGVITSALIVVLTLVVGLFYFGMKAISDKGTELPIAARNSRRFDDCELYDDPDGGDFHHPRLGESLNAFEERVNKHMDEFKKHRDSIIESK